MWSSLPSASLPRDVGADAARELAAGAESVRVALADGSPVDSGALRDSFVVTGSADRLTVSSPLRYAEFVEIDTTAAAAAITDTDAAIVAAVERQFEGGSRG